MTRCSLCPGTNACLQPDGPVGGLLFIGEAPGKQENQKGRVFIGKTGDEVNRHYLPLAGLRREAVRFTNAIRCYPVSAGGKLNAQRAKDIELLQSCVECHLYPDIERGRPRLLVPLGSFACRAVCPGLDLELQHGIPLETAWGIPAFPMFHPALGIHEPKKMLMIRTDWQRLRAYLAGTYRRPTDDYEPDYHEVTDESEIELLDPRQPLACDTESTRRHEPFCLTYSQEPGTGQLITATNHRLLQAFQTRLNGWRAPVLFHNWLYDWPVTEAMGLQFPHHHLVDTMSVVFHLGNLPQGLKALAWRELGMTMQDFDDVVLPHSRANVLHYYQLLQTEEWPRPEEELVQDSKTGLFKMYRPQSMNTKLKRFFTDLSKAPDTKDVFDMWGNWESSHAMLEARMGPWPGKCISHVPFEQTLFYACRDADALIRLWPVLNHMRARVRHGNQETWRN